MPTASSWPSADLYKVLALPHPWSGAPCTADDIKSAYRRALLKYHPDKAAGLGFKSTSKGTGSRPEGSFSVDEISQARDILLDPAQKREYDKYLQLCNSTRREGLAGAPQGTGLEVIDLEDMDFSEDLLAYVRSCRCGNDVGFQATEEELDREAEHGEILVSCPGCSLTARILYQAE